MDLEHLSVRLRPRTGWESVDLGFALIRHWWRPIYGIWLTLAAPMALLLVSLLGGLGLVLFWWLLPVCEAMVLFTLSRAVFGSVPPWKQALRAAPRLWWQAAGELFLRRLRPTRILYLPLAQLEGLRGKKRRQRASALGVGQDVSGLLLVVFVVFELVLWSAVLVFVVMMTPGWMGVDWQLVAERFFDGTLAPSGYFFARLLVVAVVLALHPLYVSAGFALYLTRRTDLEGWDLEIAFRRLSRRLSRLGVEPRGTETPTGGSRSTGTGVRDAVIAILLAVSLVASLAPGQVLVAESLAAAESPTPETAPVNESETQPAVRSGVWTGDPERDPRRLIADVMELQELQRDETVGRWRLRQDLFDDDAASSSSEPYILLAQIARGIAAVGEPLLWLVLAATLGLLLRAAWRRLPEGPLPDRGDKPSSPERLFGLDLRPETLPADVPGEAEALWQTGRHAAALSLLYRGALGRLAAEGLELRDSFTEDDCLRAARAGLEPRRLDFFAELTRAWQRVAYAHRVPESSRARGLWSQWADHFGGAA